MPTLLTMLLGAGGDKALVKAAQSALPWVMKNPRTQAPVATAEEIAAADAELEADIICD